MGQISSPLSMRYAKSMHWPTLWSDSLNFNKKFKVDVLLNTVLPLFFNESIYLNSYLNTKNVYFYLNTSFNFSNFSLKKFYLNSFFKKKLNFNSLETMTPFFLSFFGKLWIIRFNNWLVCVFFTYSPKKIGDKNTNSDKVITKSNYIFWKSKTNLILNDFFQKKKINFFF